MYECLVFVLGYSYNFSTLYSDFHSLSAAHSAEPFPKCCFYNESISIAEGGCILADFDIGVPHKNWPEYLERFNLHSPDRARLVEVTQEIEFERFFDNGTVNIRMGSKVRNLERGSFCLDVQRKYANEPWIMLMVDNYDVWLSLQPEIVFDHVFFFWVSIYWLSFLFIVLTFIIYISMPELRVKVKNKCFSCYLAVLILAMICLYMDDYEFITVLIEREGTYLIKHA